MKEKTITIRSIAELVSDEFWLYDYFHGKRSDTRFNKTPTLQERISVADNLCKSARRNGKYITFNSSGNNLVENFIAYNYLVLFACDYSNKSNEIFKIAGFNRFNELKEFVLQKCRTIKNIYVNDGGIYKPAFFRFYYNDEQSGKKLLANDYSVHYGIVDNANIVSPIKQENKGFMILGVCEFNIKNDVWCAFAKSLEDVQQILETRVFYYESKHNTSPIAIGTWFFEGHKEKIYY